MWRCLALALLFSSGCSPGGRAGVPVGGPEDALAAPRDAAAPEQDLAPPAPDLTPVGQCLAGLYGGTYDGTVLFVGVLPIPTQGTVELTLAQQQGEFAQIQNGQISGDASGNPYSADVVGTLDCTTNRLEMGFLKNGKVTVSGVTYLFEGPFLADYDPQTATFVNGTWNVKQIGGNSTGMGTWTATHR
jgi:hypothetical protein